MRLSKAASKCRWAALSALVSLVWLTLSVRVRSQALSSSADSPATTRSPSPGTLGLTYLRPTEGAMVRNYIFDGFGPYPIVGAAFAAGINQLNDSPPEWNQGIEGYSKRFGSNFGIAAVGTSTRYGLAEAFREDTLYYRCQCTGAFPRLRHAMLFDINSAPRRRRPSRLLFPRARRTLCGLDGCGLRLVSRPFRRERCIPNGQL